MFSSVADKPSNRLRFRAGYVKPTLIEMKFDSVKGAKETLYFSRAFILNNEQHILKHKMSWKKENFRGLWVKTIYAQQISTQKPEHSRAASLPSSSLFEDLI